jgi:hypothetical protein
MTHKTEANLKRRSDQELDIVGKFTVCALVNGELILAEKVEGQVDVGTLGSAH